MDQYDIELVFRMVKKSEQEKISGSSIVDVEVAMLPNTCTAVINYINQSHKK